MPTDVVSLRRRKQNVTIYVGSDNDWTGRLFCFERGPHSLVIQTPELKIPGYVHFGVDPEADKQYFTTFYHDLEKIAVQHFIASMKAVITYSDPQTLVRNIEFGKTNWAYLVTRKDGSYRLHYKEKPILPISCPPWAPLIPEEDILYTKYINAEDREALWNGRLDCTIGWNDWWREHVDFLMRGHRLLNGLDVTFQVLGHIVRNGEIIGLMTEHAVDDRRVEHRDRAAVYAAVAKVQSRGLAIRLHESNISMHRNQVRFLDAQTVLKLSEVADVDKIVTRYHLQALSTLFDELRQQPNPIPLLRDIQNNAVPFIPVPAPEKPLETNRRHMTSRLLEARQSASNIQTRLPLLKTRNVTDWMEYLQTVREIMQSIKQCAKDVKEIETSILSTERQNDFSEDLRESRAILDTIIFSATRHMRAATRRFESASTASISDAASDM
ncbi:hypothetical protein B0H19DRAFT_1262796 [Mycena capillaripes]|nr:hypothetical protein B0H19DRAFT_1262796 [Mycena capillaripes]